VVEFQKSPEFGKDWFAGVTTGMTTENGPQSEVRIHAIQPVLASDSDSDPELPMMLPGFLDFGIREPQNNRETRP